MLESKIFAQGFVNNFDGHCDELPTLLTNLRTGAARSDAIVICHIDIEDKLFADRSKHGSFPEGLTISRIGRVNRTDLET